jgi:phage terminase large subunit GpA-like protein
MADQILDREVFPSWQGERTRLVYEFPTNEKRWAEYVEIRNDSLRAGGTGEKATKYYRKHRKEMDAGCRVAWKDWYNPDEISAIQHAMNLKTRDKGGERAFWSEFQNQPLPPDEELYATRILEEMVLRKLNGLPKRRIPSSVSHLTSFIDVHGEILYWMVCAWENDFTGYVLDYGTFPDQSVDYFTLSAPLKPLSAVAPKGAGLEGRLYAGIEAACKMLFKREWKVEGGSSLPIGKIGIDANWGKSTDVVYRYCLQSPYGASVIPTHGKYYGASSIPMSDHKRKPGELMGVNWRVPPASSSSRQGRHAIFDTDFWKSFVLQRIATEMGDPGSMTVYGTPRTNHKLLCDHLSAEFSVQTIGRGRTVDEWKTSGADKDNHWLDCIVGCAMTAAMLGVELFKSALKVSQKSIKLSEIRKAKKTKPQSVRKGDVGRRVV